MREWWSKLSAWITGRVAIDDDPRRTIWKPPGSELTGVRADLLSR